jgi:hypothetical protein
MTQYYLLDGVIAHQELNDLKPVRRHDVAWLYGILESDKANVSPILISDDDAILRAKIQTAEQQDNAYQWIQRFDSDFTLEQLAAHFKQFNTFVVEEGRAYYLRYTDPRVIAYLSQVFTAQQWQDFISPTQNWHYLNRDNEWTALDYPNNHPIGLTHTAEPTLTNEQMNKLLDLSMPDTLLKDVLESGSELEDFGTRSQLHNWAKQSHTISKNWGNYPDELMLCMLAIRSKGVVLQNKGWLNTLAKHPHNRLSLLSEELAKLEVEQI